MENRRPWTPEEIALLDERYAAGVLVKIIAGELGRSVHSVNSRLDRKQRDRRRYERRERFFVTVTLSPVAADVIRQRSADLGQAYGRIIAAIIEGALSGEVDAWLVTWGSDGTPCRRAYTDENEARRWAERMADTEGCSDVRLLPLAARLKWEKPE